jgi:GTP cyclohydrolase I
MASIKKATKATSTQKTKYEEIEKQLATVLESFKKDLGDKKFNQRIKKAVKVITHGLNKKKAAKVKVAKVKKVTIKASKPAPSAIKEKKAVKAKKAEKK